MSLFRMLAVAAALTLTAGTVSGCTCNKAGTSRKARPKNPKLTKQGKMRKAKLNRRTRGQRNVQRVPAKLYFVDKAKFDAGDEDYWVEVTREVGSKAPAKNAVWNLFKGPNEDEKAKGLVFFDSQTAGFQGFSIEGDTVTLQLRGACSANGGTVTVYDHLAKTLKRFPEIEHVRVVGPDESVPTDPGDHRPACLEP